MVYLSKAYPGGLIATGSVKKVNDGVVFPGRIIICREVGDEAALRGPRNAAGAKALFYNALRCVIRTDGRSGRKKL
jgi:hypothetical protein